MKHIWKQHITHILDTQGTAYGKTHREKHRENACENNIGNTTYGHNLGKHIRTQYIKKTIGNPAVNTHGYAHNIGKQNRKTHSKTHRENT